MQFFFFFCNFTQTLTFSRTQNYSIILPSGIRSQASCVLLVSLCVEHRHGIHMKMAEIPKGKEGILKLRLESWHGHAIILPLQSRATHILCLKYQYSTYSLSQVAELYGIVAGNELGTENNFLQPVSAFLSSVGAISPIPPGFWCWRCGGSKLLLFNSSPFYLYIFYNCLFIIYILEVKYSVSRVRGSVYTCCSCKGVQFGSWSPHGDSAVTPLPGDSLPFTDMLWAPGMQLIHEHPKCQNTLTYKITFLKQKIT